MDVYAMRRETGLRAKARASSLDRRQEGSMSKWLSILKAREILGHVCYAYGQAWLARITDETEVTLAAERRAWRSYNEAYDRFAQIGVTK